MVILLYYFLIKARLGTIKIVSKKHIELVLLQKPLSELDSFKNDLGK